MAKVLIVEDDPLMSRMYQKVFKFEGYEVEMASNGEEGLEKAKTTNPTIILLDVMMPKMNGFQVLEKLKLDDVTKAIPVIMLTNLAGQQDAETAMAKGAVKYIVKSEYDPKDVANMVKEILAGYTRNDVPEAASKSTKKTVSKAKTSSPTTPKGEAVVEEKVEAVVDDKVAELSETQVESDVAGEPADDVVKEEVEEPEPADVSETPEEQVKPEVEDAEPAKTEPEKKEDVPEDEKTLESVPDISKDAPLKAESVDDDSDDTPKLEKKNKKIFIIGVLLAGVLLLSTVALGFYFFGGQDTVEETAVEVEEAEEEPAPTLEITELVREDWTIEVLNGSGVAGAAGELQEKLEDLGYEVLEVGNADNSDYEETEVYISSDMIDEADAFIEDLEEELDIVADPQELDDEEAPAVVRIIIGSE